MPSIAEVAELAKTSKMTVSRYINYPDKVAPDTAKRIGDAMEKLSYRPATRRPGRRGRGAPETRVNRVAVLLATPFGFSRAMQLPVIPLLIAGIADELSRHDMDFRFVHIADEAHVNKVLAPGRCQAAILFGHSPLEGLSAQYLDRVRRKLPSELCVHCFAAVGNSLLNCTRINYDNDLVGLIAADYLKDRGHDTVVAFNPMPLNPTFTTRVAAFRCQAAKHNMRCLVVEGEDDPVKFAGIAHTDRMYEPVVRRYLALPKLAKAGAFFCTDEMLRGVSAVLCRRSLTLGHLDCIGCDNDSRALNLLRPRPATIDLHFELIGRESVRQLVNQISGKSGDNTHVRLIPPTLVLPDASS